MIALLQRVKEARVWVNAQCIAQIDRGILALIGVEKKDQIEQADRLLHKLIQYRIFNDDQGKMNLSLKTIEGSLLLVPQFTLAADTRKGLRPSFSSAASPEQGRKIFDHFVRQAKKQIKTESGQFGADMQVQLTNDGPVTFWLRI